MELYSERTRLMEHMDMNHEAKIADIEKHIADEACDIINDQTKGLESESGGFNPGHLWRLKDKIIPKPPQVPSAMKGSDGSLLTNKDDLKRQQLSIIKMCLGTGKFMKTLKNTRWKGENCVLYN